MKVLTWRAFVASVEEQICAQRADPDTIEIRYIDIACPPSVDAYVDAEGALMVTPAWQARGPLVSG